MNISLPFYNDERSIVVPKWGTITLYPYQILAFLSLTQRNYGHCAGAPIFPAIFDTGNSLNLTIHKDQLEAAKPWGMTFEPLRQRYRIRGLNGAVSMAKAMSADVWLHDYTSATVPETFRASDDRLVKSFRLNLAHEGIACIDDETRIDQNKNKNGLFSRLASLFTRDDGFNHETAPRAMRLRDERSNRLSLPHLPLLGLRALCINSLNVNMICTPKGGSLHIKQHENAGFSNVEN